MISLTSPIRTRAHGWPAGAKLAGLCLVSTALFVTNSLVLNAAVLALVLIGYALPGRAFLRAGLQSLRLVLPFVVIVLIWHLVTRDLRVGALICLRMMAVVALANLVTMTTRLDQMIEVLQVLTAPLRRIGLPVYLLDTAIPLMIRFTPVLVDRSRALVLAWRARSTRRPGWRLILPLTLQALDDADHVAEALRARGGPLSPDDNSRPT